MAIDDPVRLDTRHAGQIRRYHTWPIIGQQTIAEHCWHLLRIYMSIIDKIDSHMVFHIVFHDIGEHATGDAPYPIKRDNPELKEQMDQLETKSRLLQLDYWGSFHQCLLMDQDMILFKQIELIEMAEFGMDQYCLGNSHGFIIADRCLESLYRQTPHPRVVEYVKKRVAIFFTQLQFKPLKDTLREWWHIGKWEELHGSQ